MFSMLLFASATVIITWIHYSSTTPATRVENIAYEQIPENDGGKQSRQSQEFTKIQLDLLKKLMKEGKC